MDTEDRAVNLQPGAQLAMIRDLQRRVSWLERQHRLLLIEAMRVFPGAVCADSRCQAGDVPHMTEPPGLCPILIAHKPA